MKKLTYLMTALFLLPSALMAEPKPVESSISDVIVYHGQALVTRTIILDKAGGDMELLVENLPERILPESLYAQASDGIQILSVRYRIKEIEKDMRAEVIALDEQIEAIEKQLNRAARDRQLCEAQSGRFAKMWDLSFQGADLSLDRAAFSSESMKDYTTYLEEKNQAWHTRAVELEEQTKDLEKQLAKAREQKEKLAAEHKQQIRQALVYVHVPAAAAANALQLSYLVNNADWTPQYNLKAAEADKSVHVEYNAVVHQSSGEDWNNAELALSTAVPSLVATPPVLNPMQITLAGAAAGQLAISANAPSSGLQQPVPVQQQVSQQQMDLQSFNYGDQTERFAQLAQARRSSIAKGFRANTDLNFYAASNQMIEFNADKTLLQQLNEKVVVIQRAEGVCVMYKLPGKLTLPSRSDQQLVTIASIDCPAAFIFEAAPLLTDYVYLAADITNTSDTILLPGESDMFRDGEFVGKGDMKLVTIGQTFAAGFGVDSQIQVAREFKDKKVETLWGNRVDDQQYRIEISNYKNKPVAIRLMDRLPWTENPALSIELTSNSHPLSEDAEYLRTQKDKGILRWDLNLEAETNGKNATVINYGFTMKYDNDMAIRSMQ